jgi:hypothetical protein
MKSFVIDLFYENAGKLPKYLFYPLKDGERNIAIAHAGLKIGNGYCSLGEADIDSSLMV